MTENEKQGALLAPVDANIGGFYQASLTLAAAGRPQAGVEICRAALKSNQDDRIWHALHWAAVLNLDLNTVADCIHHFAQNSTRTDKYIHEWLKKAKRDLLGLVALTQNPECGDRIELLLADAKEALAMQKANPELKKQLGIAESDKVIGHVSLGSQDDLDVLIEACASLSREGEKFKLLLVSGEHSLRPSVRAAIEDSKNLSWIINAVSVTYDQLPDYYSLIDIVVVPRGSIPTKHPEQPLQLAEALAYQKPTISSDTAPLSKYIGENAQVATFKSGNVGDLKRKICSWLRDSKPAISSQPAQWSKRGQELPPGTPSTKESGPKNSSVSTANSSVHISPRHFTLVEKRRQVFAEIDVPVRGSTLEIAASVVYNTKSSHTKKKALLLFEFGDADGNRIEEFPGLNVSPLFKQHFFYLNSNSKMPDGGVCNILELRLPLRVATIKIELAPFGIRSDESITVRIQGQLAAVSSEISANRQCGKPGSLPRPIVHTPPQKRLSSDLTVACILDEFTAECLSHEVNLIKVTQQSWQSQIEENFPDFLLVESCWKGNSGDWGTLTKGSGGGSKLRGLLRHCEAHGIPTVFWNKEDPPHYEKFGPIAKFFDLVVTTDINMVPCYKADFGIDAHPLSFGAQPKIHNPEPTISRLDKAVFAGSYYADKPKRCADFKAVMHHLDLAGIDYDIFDRNHERGIEKFVFPEPYRSRIVGNLPPEDIWKAHKGYSYQVNMNSVQNSATMFARRVYESLASGTPVISNEAVGVRELFGDVVIMAGGDKSISEQLAELRANPQAYKRLACEGVRKVMREHTYGHRIQALCALLGLEVDVALPETVLAVTAKCEEDIEHAKQLFAEQTASRKRLFIELENFDTAYKYLNESNASTTFAMRLARGLYDDKRVFYGGDKVLQWDIETEISPETLEDFSYWGTVT